MCSRGRGPIIGITGRNRRRVTTIIARIMPTRAHVDFLSREGFMLALTWRDIYSHAAREIRFKDTV